MRVRLLCGPAGSGKTFRCLAEARAALGASPEGRPLILLAPRQSTYELERRILADSSLPGYTRLQILSFERLAYYIFDRLGKPAPEVLDEEGRVMALRGLLARRRDGLKLFRASARLAGFARQLSLALREFQTQKITPEELLDLSTRVPAAGGLAFKLHDLGALFRAYLDWLSEHNLQDSDFLLSNATEALLDAASGASGGSDPSPPAPSAGKSRKGRGRAPRVNPSEASQPSLAFPEWDREMGSATGLRIESLWVDGFAEFAPREIALLRALAPHCERATLTFCLDAIPPAKISWLSTWSLPARSFKDCHVAMETIPGAEVTREVLARGEHHGRFAANPVLRGLEKCWSNFSESSAKELDEIFLADSASLRAVECATPEAEAVFAAREILAHVRRGGRYREVAVLVRSLDQYHDVLERTFRRFDIPFFMDRREEVAHHPLAELTRNAIRTLAFDWESEDWFAALKSGLAPVTEQELDRLENLALERGWKRDAWLESPRTGDPRLDEWVEDLQKRLLPPFRALRDSVGGERSQPDGPALAAAIRRLWEDLRVESQLESWSDPAPLVSGGRPAESPHTAVWRQMNNWIENLVLAFPGEHLRLREWLPILEAGLSSLTVGVIPPALDQVLIGAIDRSRNPEITAAILLGVNETVFPAPPPSAGILTEQDREEMARRQKPMPSRRQQLGRERYYGYLACTRPREKLTLCYAASDREGRRLNASPFIARLRSLFPSLKIESFKESDSQDNALHPSELIVSLLKQNATGMRPTLEDIAATCSTPALKSFIGELKTIRQEPPVQKLNPRLAEKLYGPVLRTSVSRIEQFAACPFRFFVHSGLRAEERKIFELDVREQGSFQHEILAAFHKELREENKRWRDITPAEARERIRRIGSARVESYRDGLMGATGQTRFLAGILVGSLEDFVEILVQWMRSQYLFDPVEVELGFGPKEKTPAWELDLGQNRTIALSGRIDRVDLWKRGTNDEALCVVLDYKSGLKRLDPVLIAHGLQLQLLAYLNVLRHCPNAEDVFGVKRLVPVGVFYVSLRARLERQNTRTDALAAADASRKAACAHTGRFDVTALLQLDARNTAEGDQFNYRRNQGGELRKNQTEALDPEMFAELLDSVETNLRAMGTEIFAGNVAVSPYRKGSSRACDYCDYESICRIDPWTQEFRVLTKPERVKNAS